MMHEAAISLERDRRLRDEILYEINIPEVELYNVFPQNERAIRMYVLRRVQEAKWDRWARLINSDTE